MRIQGNTPAITSNFISSNNSIGPNDKKLATEANTDYGKVIYYLQHRIPQLKNALAFHDDIDKSGFENELVVVSQYTNKGNELVSEITNPDVAKTCAKSAKSANDLLQQFTALVKKIPEPSEKNRLKPSTVNAERYI